MLRFVLMILLSFGFGVAYCQSSLAPEFIPTFETLKEYDTGKVFDSEMVSSADRHVFIFYDPGCGHCQRLGHGIDTNLEELNPNAYFYFVSMSDKALVDEYRSRFTPRLSNHRRVKFLLDEVGEFITLFEPAKFPATYIFDGSTNRLIRDFQGSEFEDSMRKLLQ